MPNFIAATDALGIPTASQLLDVGWQNAVETAEHRRETIAMATLLDMLLPLAVGMRRAAEVVALMQNSVTFNGIAALAPHDRFNYWLATELFYALVGQPTNLLLVVPRFTQEGKPIMANFEITNTTVAHIPIETTAADGTVEPAPAGDVFSAASSDPGIVCTIGTDAAGNPEFVATPVKRLVSAATLTLTDSAGLTAFTIVADVIMGTNPATNDILNVSGATFTPQPEPAS